MSEERFGFNGKEKDNEVKGVGNSYDFGARIHDPRLGRWLSLDPLMKKYPDLSPYCFVANTPIGAKDADGRDIIILSASSHVMGLGHAAILIGNANTGYVLYSKNGTNASSGTSGPSDKNPQAGIPFNSLEEFANSPENFDEDGNVIYTAAIKITTSEETDQIMSTAAKESVKSAYNVCTKSCIDVPTDALEAAKKTEEGKNFKSGKEGVKNPIPNARYKKIAENNPTEDVSEQITPKQETVNAMKTEAENKKEITKQEPTDIVETEAKP